MSDLLVNVGIDDRGVKRGLRSVESTVRDSQRRMEYARPAVYDPLRFDKGLSKITSSLTGVSMKYGGVYAVYQGLKKAYEELEKFDAALPEAERKLDRFWKAVKPDMGYWAPNMFSMFDGISSGPMMSKAIPIAKSVSEYLSPKAITQAIGDSLKSGMAASGAMGPQMQGLSALGAMLFGGYSGLETGTSAEVDKAASEDASLIGSFGTRKAKALELMSLEAELKSIGEDKLATERALAELKLQQARSALEQQVSAGKSRSDAQAELEVHRKIRDASIQRAEAAERDRVAREQTLAIEKEKSNWKSIYGEWDIKSGMRFDEMSNRISAHEAAAITPQEKLAAKLERINMTHEQRLRAAQNMVRDNKFLSENDASDLYSSINELRDAERDAAIREANAPKDMRKDAPDGLDLSSAGAFASQGQAMAFQIPGKIDQSNQMFRQANSTLQRIEQKLDSTARFVA